MVNYQPITKPNSVTVSQVFEVFYITVREQSLEVAVKTGINIAPGVFPCTLSVHPSICTHALELHLPSTCQFTKVELGEK